MKRFFTKIAPLLLVAVLLIPSQAAQAQKKKKKKKGDTEAAAPKEKTDYEKISEKGNIIDGLFPMYRDTADGTTYLTIHPDQLDQEYIYFSYVANGVVDAGYFTGGYRGSKIIKFTKVYDHIEVIEQNTSFYFDENNAISKASEANINNPILANLKIKATEDSTGIFIVNGDEIFKSENFQMVKRPSRKGSPPGMLGKLSKGKTKISEIRNYPENTDIIVDYVYENPNPQKFGSAAVTDPRFITVKYQHSLIAVPENNFKPRRDDARIGYFMTKVNDMTSYSSTPYRDMIHRWNLEKKDPSAAISEPVEPIVYWIENTTPVEFRPIIQAAGERWNQAFEKAGFKNALVVKIQPDTADWDAGDIRFNVLRWTSSPRPPFGGYGPSFVNPRTGQILGADVMLEYAVVGRRLFRKETFEKAGMSNFDAPSELDHDHTSCMVGDVMNHNMMFGLTALEVNDASEAAKEKFVEETLYRLILHEIGHTLGLTHNMRASAMLTYAETQDAAVVEARGLCNSVMEYPAVNYAADPALATRYYDENPGPYDLWVIEYGYSPSTDDVAAEEARLESILARSTEADLAYGNDGDDMRSSGKGIDPDINIYDLSSDQVQYGVARIELVNELMPGLVDKYSTDGDSYQSLLLAYMSLTGEYANQINIFTRQIGGIHINRAKVGQAGDDVAPFTPVSAERQKEAMDALTKYAFAPDAYMASTEVYSHLQMQRRGFSQPRNGEDPKIHARNLNAQKRCLSHLLHANVLQRITDGQLYGNTYSLDAYWKSLTDAMFKADIGGSVNTMRQNLQIEYTQRLAGIISNKKYDHVARSMALYEMNRIDQMAKNAGGGNTLSKAHRAHLRQIIKAAKEA